MVLEGLVMLPSLRETVVPGRSAKILTHHFVSGSSAKSTDLLVPPTLRGRLLFNQCLGRVVAASKASECLSGVWPALMRLD